MRRVLEETVEVDLIEMRWDEHWADVEFVAEGFGVEQLQTLLVPAGAWCDARPGGAGR